jgi:hypothetical protein
MLSKRFLMSVLPWILHDIPKMGMTVLIGSLAIAHAL